MNDKITITKRDYAKMERRLEKLDALEAGGVDNWDGYSFSLEDWFKSCAEDEAIYDFVQNLNDILADAKIDEPAGRGAGHSIEYDEDAVSDLVRKLIRGLEDA